MSLDGSVQTAFRSALAGFGLLSPATLELRSCQRKRPGACFSVSIPFMQISQTLLSCLRRLAGLSLRSASVPLADVHQSSNMQIKKQQLEIKEVQLANNEASHTASVPAFPVNDGIITIIMMAHHVSPLYANYTC